MAVEIVPIEERHADGFHACIDSVAKEKKFLSLLEAPPFEGTRAFVRGNIETGQVQLVALDDGKVVGWCDILKTKREACSHVGAVGGAIGLYRSLGFVEEGRMARKAKIDGAYLNMVCMALFNQGRSGPELSSESASEG